MKLPVHSFYVWNARHAKKRYFVLKKDEKHRAFLEWYVRKEDKWQGKYRRQIQLDHSTLEYDPDEMTGATLTIVTDWDETLVLKPVDPVGDQHKHDLETWKETIERETRARSHVRRWPTCSTDCPTQPPCDLSRAVACTGQSRAIPDLEAS